MSARRLMAFCVLVVLAGCVGPLGPGGQPPGSTDGTASAAATPASTPTVLPGSARNPWRSSEVVVGVASEATPDRSYVALVERAVAYWNGPGRPNATYPATFRVDADATDPDVLVVVRERVTCAEDDDVLGCAPVLSADDRPPRPATIQVAAGFSDEATVTALEHEFGHLLGIRHGEPPLPLMEPRFAAATLPATDAANKSNPWTTTDLRVYVDLRDATGERETRRFQVQRAVEYYDDGAAGHVPANVSFALVEDRSRAQVHVVFDREREGCSTDEPHSCGFWSGYDPDRDGALEYYTNATIVVNGIDADATGWHVGYWLGVLMGHDRPGELAPPFRDASYEERRSAWWE